MKKKTKWISGEVCREPGRYYSESCNHELEREFCVNDIFTHCPYCQKAVRWTRIGALNGAELALSFLK
jgi:hypothetical protein